ncbi:MAG: metal-dependent hydrolase [Deltaproteobacteria bacterium]|nr:metal-dependent hydrolase [Deltaproteobacteria bacterium]
MANTKVKWLGHAGFQITSATGKVVLIDPWFSGNPLAPCGADDIKKADLLLVTHDHFDHSGDAAQITVKTGATLVGMPETVGRLQAEGGVPESQIVFGMGMNIGGTYQADGIEITMVQAFHSSQTGAPAGYIVKLEDGFTIYHAGDTGIFDSMKVWGELYTIDLALLPIGSVFTMDPRQAALAAKMLGAKKVIPMHFKSFPILVQDAAPFVEALKKAAPAAQAVVMEPGEEQSF